MEKILVEVFQWLHRHPELAMKEHQTTEYLRKALLGHGVNLLDTELETGLIAMIGTGKDPVIALRADIDALPIEKRVTGTMNAAFTDHLFCGTGETYGG